MVEWLLCVAEPVDDVQDQLQMTKLVLAPYPLHVQTRRGLIYESIDVRPVV